MKKIGLNLNKKMGYKIEFEREFSLKKLRKDWRWKITSLSNGKIIASSSEGFRNFIDCEKNLYITGKAIAEYNVVPYE